MPVMTPFANNNEGIVVPQPGFDYAKFRSQGQHSTKVYHGISIVVNDKIIGRIQSYQNQAKTRQATHKYELNHLTFGRPVDIVPGRSEGYTTSITRAEVWDKEIEIALGYGSVFTDLMDMTFPFELHEFLYKGKDLNKHWIYPSCWITSIGDDPYDAGGGDGIIQSTLEIMHLPRRLITGS